MDCWHPSPAYDLTWSTTYFGEHSTTVDRNGKNPGMKALLAVGKAAGMNVKNCRAIAEEIWEKKLELESTYVRHSAGFSCRVFLMKKIG